MKKFNVDSNAPQFPSFLQGFNKRWFANNCLVVYVCYTSEGVVNAVEEATNLYGGNVKLKSGGHCYENFVFSEETLAIIDVTGLDQVGYDPERGYYLGSGGNNWEAFKSLFRDFGKVLPAGSCYSVGLGGHICGGGYGLLSRLNGLTVDWLTGVELVVKRNEKAELVYVSEESTGDQLDLFWSQRGGGGGNFGAITRYYFKVLPNSPNIAYISTYAFEWDSLTVDTLYELLLWYENFAINSPREQFGLFKLNHETNGEIHLIIQTAVQHLDAKHEAELLIEEQGRQLMSIMPHRPPKSPLIGHTAYFTPDSTATTVEYTYYEATQTLNGSGPNQRGKYKSAYMRKGFSREKAQVIFDHLRKIPAGLSPSDMSQSLLQVDSYGGAINMIRPTATPIPQRDSTFKLQYQTYWTFEENDPQFLNWIRDFYGDMYSEMGGVPNPKLDPDHNVDGCYYNYPDSDLNELVGREGAMQLYFLENLDRLKQVKRTWDPHNYFNNAQSIPLE
jgi:hypothetical protein